MAYTITLDPEVLASLVSENVVVVQDSGTSNDPVAIAIDYTSYISRIAVALETIATNTTTIAEQLTPSTNLIPGEVLADQFSRLRYLADPALDDASTDRQAGTGIRTAQPYGPIISALLYKTLILEGGILTLDPAKVDNSDAEKTAQDFNDIIANASKVENLAYRRINDLLDSMQTMSQFK